MTTLVSGDRYGSRRKTRIGELGIDAVGVEDTARAFIDYCRSRTRLNAERPVYSTSVNGHVISVCARDNKLAKLFAQADLINADGQALVFLSRLLCRTSLPERVATTDLFPAVARRAAFSGITFYMLGGEAEINRRAVEETQKRFPSLQIVGARDGYFERSDEAEVIAEITRLKPDVLWISLGAPLEQEFVTRNLDALRGVGVVKTSGGLFDFLALAKRRAPLWVQRAGFEWLFRMALEPRRLFMRYLVTSPHAVLVMLRAMR